MEKITEKIGTFDLMVTTFPGAYFILLLKNLYDFLTSLIHNQTTMSVVETFFSVLKFSPRIPRSVYEFIIFSFASFITGILLQEVSSVLKEKVIYRKGKPQQLLFERNNGTLSSEQINQFTPLFKKLGMKEDLDSIEKKQRMIMSQHMFHMINTQCQKKGLANKYVKLSIISNMSYNLFVATFFLFIFVFSFEIQLLLLGISFLSRIIIFVFLFAALYFFFKRGEKFNGYWIINMIYAYEADYNTDTTIED